jgi:hypothetical protein
MTEDAASISDLESLEELVNQITPPLSLEEARTLLPLLDRESDDSLYGMVWTVLHLLETAPGWPPPELLSLASPDRPWFRRLTDRARNGGLL